MSIKDRILAKQGLKPSPKPEDPKTVTFGCGHPVHLAQLHAMDCPSCLKAKRIALAAKTRESAVKGRLPDGSVVTAIYNAAAETWTGSLTLAVGMRFEAAGGSQTKLLHALDDLYRAWLKESENSSAPLQ